MVSVLYVIEREFMRKTFESLDQHVDAESAYVPARPEAVGSCDLIPEVHVDDVEDVDENVRSVDPDVVVYNHRFRIDEVSFHEEYPLVHVRHGASVGRGEVETTVESTAHAVDVALAPGGRWAEQYVESFPESVRVSVVGIPEADDLVTAERPHERRVLYAPTNHNYGGGSYLHTAHDVLDLFADSDYELLFRPHPMDRIEEPGQSLTEECRERIADLPNVVFDEHSTPRDSVLAADVLLSDYSGIVTEWLHTGRPLVQFTDLADEAADVPRIGHVTSAAELTLDDVDALYDQGYSERAREREAAFRNELGIPMDGRAGERAAQEVVRCTQ
ncbi:CDP-glycerol glycerophosphotransferase family protein [Halobacterium zhouii]|uniref:CDP-glycerol glycerophosphotransferase family protein n=1 Tax=Halobacterium zhouii TaxID=2902624 RepID=UPI001E47BBA7|nr:CDP-glycerol glycerophosphotransferase family protein [Halobacterium zhouii]